MTYVPPIGDEDTEAPPVNKNTEDIKTRPWLYWTALLVLFGFYVALGWYCNHVAGNGFEFGYVVWAFGLLHFISGFDVIKRNEIAGVFVLGIPTEAFSGAFICAPAGIFQQQEVTALVVELPWPQDPNKVWRGKPDDPNAEVPLGYFLPVRITFNDAPEAERGDDPFQRRATHEVSLFVRIRVEDFFNFYARIGDTDKNIGTAIDRDYGGDPANMLVNAREQIGNMSINLINQLFTKLSPAQALAALKEANPSNTERIPPVLTVADIMRIGVDRILQNHIRRETQGWGIDVVTARVKLIEPSKTFNVSIQNAALGAADARGAAARAVGEKAKRTLEGEGDAAAITAKVTADILARADGLKKMAKKLKVPVETLIAQEVARAIAEGENEKIILPGFDISKLVETIMSGFKKPGPA
jgi:hypothetical protein